MTRRGWGDDGRKRWCCGVLGRSFAGRFRMTGGGWGECERKRRRCGGLGRSFAGRFRMMGGGWVTAEENGGIALHRLIARIPMPRCPESPAGTAESSPAVSEANPGYMVAPRQPQRGVSQTTVHMSQRCTRRGELMHLLTLTQGSLRSPWAIFHRASGAPEESRANRGVT